MKRNKIMDGYGRFFAVKFRIGLCFSLFFALFLCCSNCTQKAEMGSLSKEDIDPTTLLWYTHPADKWQNALPVGNGRLGAMVFGLTEEEKIQFNEETYWSGGPYSQTAKGGFQALPEIQKLVFQGKYIQAHKLFGRHLMGYPVEQQKYQSFGDLIIDFQTEGEVTDYIHRLDLDRAIVTTEYKQAGVRFRREVFATPLDQVIVVRLTADRAGSLSFAANLRGYRNTAHSNYATDYFRMDGHGRDGLALEGKSADYLGIEGKIRYHGRVKALAEGGRIEVLDTDLIVADADAVTLYIAAATNFNNYKDVSADPVERVERVIRNLEGKNFEDIKKAHIAEHQRLFRRVSLDLGSTGDSYLPTDERIKLFDGENDPNLAALCFQYGRYMLISSSRPGTQPANLQGIWNADMNPSWDSKYTTNINTEMNYWPAEVGNLSECAKPLFQMIEELTDQGGEVAKEHYGARGWVFHQNTDIWRVAAPMDGPDWGAFTTGGAWLCTHLWEHYLFSGDQDFLKNVYPAMKGCAEFFLDFLVEHPEYGWLVTNPSTSPENFPDWPGNDHFYDEVCAWMSPGTTICAGSTIDMQLLSDLFAYVAETADILGIDRTFRDALLATRAKLAPMQIGKGGNLQEWLEDWGQKEKSHRHISHLYGLFPGNQISARKTPELAEAAKAVLNQRGLVGNGWASAWKIACWARLQEAPKAIENFNYYIHNYCFDSLFAICSRALQVDGLFGISAAIAEMLLQSHGQEIHLLPAAADSWGKGFVRGLRARGGFEVGMQWENRQLKSAQILSILGESCRIRTELPVEVFVGGNRVNFRPAGDGLIEFDTDAKSIYEIVVVQRK
jgi:alpha-L-fucosidase 2